MTIAIGMRCVDGMVLCADSLESDTVTKRYVNKIWSYEVVDSWGLAIASAGEADLADSFNEGLKDILGNSEFDEAILLSKLRSALRQIRLTYTEAEFGFLACVYGHPTITRKLFRVQHQSSHLGPVNSYQALGIGSALATFLCEALYSPSMMVAEAARLGVFIVDQVKIHTDGCGGPTSLISFGGVEETNFRMWTRDQITTIERELSKRKWMTLF